MRFLTRQPPEHLRGIVAELWDLEDDGRMSAGLPKPYVELVVSLSGVHWWRSTQGGPEHRYVDAWVTPLQHGARYARSVGVRRLVGVRLEPHAAHALFGALPPGDGSPPPRLSDVIGVSSTALRRGLLSERTASGRLDILCRWIEERSSSCQIGRLDSASLSARGLRRRFVREVGVSARHWRLLRRLDGVLRDPALGDPEQPLSQLAQEHGYSDQPHLSREIARFTGSTPGKLRRRPAGGPPHLVDLG